MEYSELLDDVEEGTKTAREAREFLVSHHTMDASGERWSIDPSSDPDDPTFLCNDQAADPSEFAAPTDGFRGMPLSAPPLTPTIPASRASQSYSFDSDEEENPSPRFPSPRPASEPWLDESPPDFNSSQPFSPVQPQIPRPKTSAKTALGPALQALNSIPVKAKKIAICAVVALLVILLLVQFSGGSDSAAPTNESPSCRDTTLSISGSISAEEKNWLGCLEGITSADNSAKLVLRPDAAGTGFVYSGTDSPVGLWRAAVVSGRILQRAGYVAPSASDVAVASASMPPAASAADRVSATLAMDAGVVVQAELSVAVTTNQRLVEIGAKTMRLVSPSLTLATAEDLVLMQSYDAVAANSPTDFQAVAALPVSAADWLQMFGTVAKQTSGKSEPFPTGGLDGSTPTMPTPRLADIAVELSSGDLARIKAVVEADAGAPVALISQATLLGLSGSGLQLVSEGETQLVLKDSSGRVVAGAVVSVGSSKLSAWPIFSSS